MPTAHTAAIHCQTPQTAPAAHTAERLLGALARLSRAGTTVLRVRTRAHIACGAAAALRALQPLPQPPDLRLQVVIFVDQIVIIHNLRAQSHKRGG